MSEIWTATLTLAVLFVAGFGFIWREMNRRFDAINARLDRIDQRIDALTDVLREHAERLTALEHR